MTTTRECDCPTCLSIKAIEYFAEGCSKYLEDVKDNENELFSVLVALVYLSNIAAQDLKQPRLALTSAAQEAAKIAAILERDDNVSVH